MLRISILKAIAVLLLMKVNRSRGTDEPPMDEEHAKDIQLFDRIYQMVQSCVVKDDVKLDDCLEMFKGPDHSNTKYTPCKCLIHCVTSTLEMMHPDGTYDFAKLRHLASQVDSDYFRKEIERVLDICETEPGKECEGGFNIVNCAIQHSHVAARAIRMMLETLDEHYSKPSTYETVDLGGP